MELVNPVPVEEVEPWLAALATTLLGAPWDDEFPRRVDRWRREWDAERTWGVRDHGRWVGTLATDPRTLTVPEQEGTTGDIAADALTGVTVAATHRRRGLLRRMISESLQAAVDRGDPVSVLIAAEWPIYGRYGYSPAARAANYTMFPKRAGATVTPDDGGFVRQIEPVELAAHAPAIFERARRRWAGQVSRPGSWWPRRLGTDGYEPMSAGRGTWILHESDDGPDGLLCWKVARDFELSGDLGAVEVIDFEAASDRAYRNLWAYLSGLDVIGEITLHGRPIDEPVRWLLQDGRALRQDYAGDDLWLRLLDVPSALSARSYAAPDRIVLEVVDPDGGGFAAGRYALDAGRDGASCGRTTESADLVLPQRALASAYLGDYSLRAMAIAGGLDELSPGALSRADAMFATAVRPWNATPF
jgi:predicted acetyltransferase